MKKIGLLVVVLCMMVAVPAFAGHFGFGMNVTQGSYTPGVLGVAQSGSLAGSVAVGPGQLGTATANVDLNGAGGTICAGCAAQAATQSSTTASLDSHVSFLT